MPGPAVLLLEEAADLLGLSAGPLLDLVRAGQVPCGAFRGSLRFSRGAMVELDKRWRRERDCRGIGVSPVIARANELPASHIRS